MNNRASLFPHSSDGSSEITRFWLVRHAVVSLKDRSYLYGSMDIPICLESVYKQQKTYQYLAGRLPRTPLWFRTSLSRTEDTALHIQKAGYGRCEMLCEDAFLEQNLGKWQGLTSTIVAKNCHYPIPSFWPLSAEEIPPKGETLIQVKQRVGKKLEELSLNYLGKNIIIVCHGGSIRAALSYALNIPMNSALSFSISNLSLTVLEKHSLHWRCVTVNENFFT